MGRYNAMEKRVLALESFQRDTQQVLQRDVTRLENLNTRIKEATTTLREQSAGLAAKIGGVESDFRKVTGRIEEIDYLNQKVSDDLLIIKKFLDTKFRVSFVKLPKDLPKEPKALFEYATRRMAAKNYDLARVVYQHYVQEHPNHELVGEAELAMGETYRLQRRYKDALKVYFKLYAPWEGRESKAPPHVATGLWLAGQALIDSGACPKARQMFKMLSRYFKTSPEAAKAKEWLKTAQCE